MITEKMKQDIAGACALQKDVEILYDSINDLLNPIFKSMDLATHPLEELKELIELLPRGFYRSELRTLIRKRENGESLE